VHEADINFIKTKLNRMDDMDEGSIKGERVISELKQVCEYLLEAKQNLDRDEQNREEVVAMLKRDVLFLYIFLYRYGEILNKGCKCRI
jgi:hypothetical protein